ncbi:serine protease [Isosphaeraceae bacterium EP7]
MQQRSVVAIGFALALLAAGPGAHAAELPGSGVASPKANAEDDLTIRPTVLIRQGRTVGSGTIIASVAGETLVLTASHVVNGREPIVVELHRYNLGREAEPAAAGARPMAVKGDRVGDDRHGDVAVVRIRGMRALPYVARLTAGDEEPAQGSKVTSVGIDLATNLSRWSTTMRGVAWLDMTQKEEERPFLVTTKAPEHGRSGGGLYQDALLIGVCVGRAEFDEGRTRGVFAGASNIRLVLQERGLMDLIAQSEQIPLADRSASFRRGEIAPGARRIVPVPTAAGSRSHGR